MSVLLHAGVEVAFLTKGFVTEPFHQLFACTPDLVFAQVGITTIDISLWRAFEPRTAPPQRRIETIAALTKLGVRTVARLDPLIPDITDTEENLAPLFDALRKTGVTAAAASHVFIRPGVSQKVSAMLQLDSTNGSKPRIEPWPFTELVQGAGSEGTGKYEARCRRFERVRLAGEACGITITSCRCKNPQLGGVGCEIAGPASVATNESEGQGLLDFK
jgi:DNA repair photolyase